MLVNGRCQVDVGANLIKRLFIGIGSVNLEGLLADVVDFQNCGNFLEWCEGRPIVRFDSIWFKALEMAGIEDFHFHDLRHTFATYALLSSKDLRGMSHLLGHANISQTV